VTPPHLGPQQAPSGRGWTKSFVHLGRPTCRHMAREHCASEASLLRSGSGLRLDISDARHH